MKTRPLGRTGIQVSPYALGTMSFGRHGNPDHADCARIVHRALDGGINLIDTADVYSQGESEVILGKALAGRRDDVVLATKANGAMGPDPNQRGNSRRWLIRAVEDSLRRLRTDHIDLFQIHHPDPDTDIEETLAALTDLLAGGKIRAVGSSNFPAAEIVEARWTAERLGLARPRTEQAPYSILNRAVERDVLPTCQRHGLGVLVWSPLALGLLSGRYRKGRAIGENVRMHWVPRHLTDERKLDVVEQLLPLARERGLRLPHLALAFVVAHPAVSAAVIGPRTLAHLDDLIAGAGVTLDDDLLDRIDTLVAPGTDIGPIDVAWDPPAVSRPALRRRPAAERSAA